MVPRLAVMILYRDETAPSRRGLRDSRANDTPALRPVRMAVNVWTTRRAARIYGASSVPPSRTLMRVMRKAAKRSIQPTTLVAAIMAILALQGSATLCQRFEQLR